MRAFLYSMIIGYGLVLGLMGLFYLSMMFFLWKVIPPGIDWSFVRVVIMAGTINGLMFYGRYRYYG